MIGGMIEPYSAGIETHRPDPLAVKVMAEAGVKPESEAGKAGLREGIIITSVKHQGGRINITPSSADYFEKMGLGGKGRPKENLEPIDLDKLLDEIEVK